MSANSLQILLTSPLPAGASLVLEQYYLLHQGFLLPYDAIHFGTEL